MITQSCHNDPGLSMFRLLLCDDKPDCYHLAFLFHSPKPDAVTIFEGTVRYRFLTKFYHFLDCLFIVVEKKGNERGKEKERTW